MDPELLTMDDTPAEARELLDATEQAIGTLRDAARRQTDDIRARAERASNEIEETTDEQIRARQLELLRSLKPLHDQHVREGHVLGLGDEALAKHDRETQQRGSHRIVS